MAAQLNRLSASLVSTLVAFEDQDFLGDFFLIGAFFLYGRPSSRILYVSSLTFIR